MNNNHNKEINFIGFGIPETVSNLITQYQSQFKDRDVYLKPLDPHITLLPPNVLSNLSLSESINKLQGLGSKFKSFSVNLDAINHFNERTLHIVINDNTGTLHALHTAMVENFNVKQIPDLHIGENYTPHITLVQTKHHQKFSGQSFNRLIRNTRAYFDLPLKVTLQQVHVFSHTAPRTYEVTQTIQLL